MLLPSMMNWLNLRTSRTTQSKSTLRWTQVSTGAFLTLRALSFSIVAFRKSNKLGFFIKVIPHKDHDADVVVSFKMRHDFRNLAAPSRPSEDGAETPAEPIWLTHHVDLSLGPLAP